MHELNQITKSLQRPHGAVVVHNFNPLRPEVHDARNIQGIQTIRECAPVTPLPFVCILNGEPILRDRWDRIVSPGDIVIFQVLPQGGGGGKNPLRAILQIALIVAVAVIAPQLAPSVAGTIGVSTAVAQGLVSAGLYLAGSLAINAIAPLPGLPSSGAFGSQSPSPTYSVAVQGNSARLEQPIPVVYGRHIVFPDFAAQPYYEFVDNDQLYYALFCIGQGDFNVLSLKIDDTPLDSFSDVTYQIVPPNETQSLVQTNVVNSPEVSGQDMVTGQWIGGFVLTAAGFVSNKVGIDMVCPRGLYFAEDNGDLSNKSISFEIECQEIDDNDDPVTGVWTVLGVETLTRATTSPVRVSYQYNLPSPGRYLVRARRTDTRDDRSRVAHDISWSGMRAYLTTSGINTTTATQLAVRIRASEQLSGLSQRRINALVQRKIPIYLNGEWTDPQETRSIVWAYADILRNQNYGGKIPDRRIDIDTLVALDAIYTARGDYFDGIFDGRITVWEALSQVARAGRAVPLIRGGVFTLIRDGQQTLPTALFNMRNIAKNSLSIQYLTPTEETPGVIEIEYFDGLRYFPKTVSAQVPGALDLDNKAKLNLFGVTTEVQAQREALFLAACAKYRRKIVKFTTEMDGFIPAYGDLIAISHDVPSWGTSGEVVSYDPATRKLTLSEPVRLLTAGKSYIIFARKNGQPHGAYEIAPAISTTWDQVAGNWNTTTFVFTQTNGTEVNLLVDPAYPIETDLSRERTRFAFGGADTYYQLARVIAITPRNIEQVEIVAISEDNRVHSADSSLV